MEQRETGISEGRIESAGDDDRNLYERTDVRCDNHTASKIIFHYYFLCRLWILYCNIGFNLFLDNLGLSSWIT